MRACVGNFLPHPELASRQDALLWSLNERLGALCVLLGAAEAGGGLPELDLRWASEILEVFRKPAEEEPMAGADPLPGVPDMSGWDKGVHFE
ncbi:MAG TPA: hypothetical protein PLV39_14775 [Fimbriimonadaceae bacterium]|nr:hypothetical protein [Fimbriimonadaceae bacterium]